MPINNVLELNDLKIRALMRLLDLPMRIEIFYTRFGDFIFNFDTTGVIMDTQHYFRFNVSTRLETAEIVIHFYEQFHQIYVEMPLTNLTDFIPELADFEYQGNDYDFLF